MIADVPFPDFGSNVSPCKGCDQRIGWIRANGTNVPVELKGYVGWPYRAIFPKREEMDNTGMGYTMEGDFVRVRAVGDPSRAYPRKVSVFPRHSCPKQHRFRARFRP